MNTDILKGNWKQLKGRIKSQWAKLTDDDMKRIEGNLEEASGRIQERYGKARDEADREWRAFCEASSKELEQGDV